MAKEIDARGLDCPQPVIQAKNALENENAIIIIVDNTTALENLKRLSESIGCKIKEKNEDDGIYIHITKDQAKQKELEKEKMDKDSTASGPTVVVVSDDSMGRGNRDLGHVLIQGFLHTLLEVSNKPDIMLFFNNGVKLTVEGSEVIEDLNELEKNGTKILVCGTCLNFFEIKDELRAGSVSNMYEIVEAMVASGRLIQI